MKQQDIKTYIQQLLNTIEVDNEAKEIPNAILLLVVYMNGLQGKPFPLDFIGKEDGLDIEKELPAQFHTLAAQLAIKKSKIDQRTNNIKVIDYLSRNINHLLEDFINFFSKTN